MSGSTLTVLDSDGRTILGAIDDQPLRVHIELDVVPDSAPAALEVTITTLDGSTKTITAERIDWGAARPMYRSELTTLDNVGIDVINGHHVQFAHDGMSVPVQVFDSSLGARLWVTRANLADAIGDASATGANLTTALGALQELPEGAERDAIEQGLNTRLAAARERLYVLDRASFSLNNPKYYDEQKIMAAQYYMSLDARRDAVYLNEVLQRAKNIVHGHIVSGVKDITIGGYRMLVQSTGVAQARTMLTGEDEMGQAVGWEGRVTAFCDLVSDGLLQGANMKFQLDHMVRPTRTGVVEMPTKSRYDGPNPETNAPEGSIVDPTQMGMTPEAVRSAFRASRMYNAHTVVRPTNPDSLVHLQDGALPKIEGLKSKTIVETDVLLGMAPENRGLVGLFSPKTDFFETGMRSAGMTEAQIGSRIDTLRNGGAIDSPPGYQGTAVWNSAVKRYHQRSAEINGVTGTATAKLEAAGLIRIEDGVIINVATGKPYAGDHDLFDFIDANGMSVTKDVYDGMLSYLENSPFRAQHGAHKWWDPQRSDFASGEFGDAKFVVARQIYEGIIASHAGQEILIVFPPVGPPIALFSGSAPGPNLGSMPITWKPVSPGSALSLPTEILFAGMTGVTRMNLTWDESIQQWVASEADFRQSLDPSGATAQADAAVEAEFDAMAAAAATRVAAQDEALESDEPVDLSEFDDAAESEGEAGDSSGDASDGSEAEFDAMAAAAATRVAAQDEALESDEPVDLSEFDGSDDRSPTGISTGVKIGAAAAGAAALFITGFFLFGGNAEPPQTLQSPSVQETGDPPDTPTSPEDDQTVKNAGDTPSGQAGDGGTDIETSPVPPGLDPRAHIVSTEPYVTEDGTHGFIVSFSQGWDGLPVLYSFFVELVFSSEGCSMTAGYETHAGTETPLGSGPKYLLDDGTFAVDTGCPYSPDNVFEVTGRSGSQAESTAQATFDTFVGPDVPTADATTVDPSRVVVVIDAGTPEHLKVAQPTGVSNDGEKITITFAGDLKALVDGGAYKVRINAQATDGGIRVTVTLRSTEGELLLDGTTFDDADKVGSSIEGKNVETTWVWSSGGNEVVIDLVSPDGVVIPSTPPRISVKVQETESSAEIELSFQ